MSKSTRMRTVGVPFLAVMTLLAALVVMPPVMTSAVAATTNSVSLTGPNSGPWDSTRSVTAKITASPASAANRRLVRFEVRAVGAPAWTVMGTTATSATSSQTTFRFSLAVSGNYEVRATVLATATAPEATSPIGTFAITPAPTTPDTKASTPISSRTLGVNGTQGNVIPASMGSVRLWDAGVSWREIETKKGVYTWTRLDSLVKGALSRGQQILYVFGMTPTFYAQSPTTYSSVDPNRYYPGMAQPPTQLGGTDPSMAAYRAFVRALVTRYVGKISAYESWNEVNLTAYWQGTADQAALLASILGQEVAGRATLVSGSIALRSPSSFHPFAGDYLAGLAARGWPVDVYSLHPYPNFDGAAKDSGNLVGMWQRLVRDRGAPAKELWSTEINYRANGTAAQYAAATPYTASDVRALVAQSYLRGLSTGITRTYWYGWMPAVSYLGITMNTGTVAATTAVQLSTWLTGATSFNGCIAAAVNVTACQVNYATGHKWVVWSESGTQPLSGLGTVSAVTSLTGAAVPTVAGAWSVTPEPVLVTSSL